MSANESSRQGLDFYGMEFKDAVDKIIEERDRLVRENTELKRRIGDGESEELKILRSALKKSYDNSLQALSGKEAASIREFRATHNKLCHSSMFSYDIQGTGIGSIIVVRCPVCGAEENVTDFDSW